TWYTGSASWMYRVALEAILGFHKRGDELEIRPTAPAGWPEYSIAYRHGKSIYEIVVHEPNAIRGDEVELVLDGRAVDGRRVTLVDDGKRHMVLVAPRRATAPQAISVLPRREEGPYRASRGPPRLLPPRHRPS